MSLLEKLVLRCIKKRDGIPNFEEVLESFVDVPKAGSWQVTVASDQKALLTSSTLVAALLQYINSQVQVPLAKVCLLVGVIFC